jgi:hypothetical protein
MLLVVVAVAAAAGWLIALTRDSEYCPRVRVQSHDVSYANVSCTISRGSPVVDVAGAPSPFSDHFFSEWGRAGHQLFNVTVRFGLQRWFPHRLFTGEEHFVAPAQHRFLRVSWRTQEPLARHELVGVAFLVPKGDGPALFLRPRTNWATVDGRKGVTIWHCEQALTNSGEYELVTGHRSVVTIRISK